VRCDCCGSKYERDCTCTDGVYSRMNELEGELTQKDKTIKELKECVEFYAKGESHYNSEYEWGGIYKPMAGTKVFTSGYKARQCLKKLKGSK